MDYGSSMGQIWITVVRWVKFMIFAGVGGASRQAAQDAGAVQADRGAVPHLRQEGTVVRGGRENGSSTGSDRVRLGQIDDTRSR